MGNLRGDMYFLQIIPPVSSINLLPSMMITFLSCGSMSPHFIAMALAVSLLSPVTILTVIPAALHCSRAFGTS